VKAIYILVIRQMKYLIHIDYIQTIPHHISKVDIQKCNDML